MAAPHLASRDATDRSDEARERSSLAENRASAPTLRRLNAASDSMATNDATNTDARWQPSTHLLGRRLDAKCDAEADDAARLNSTKPEMVGPNKTKLTGPPPPTLAK